jgi:hypothetical protein
VLILRLRQSEVALADGRLDEAYDLAIAHDLARHRRGQRLITRLAAALVTRGHEHLRASNPTAALADCEKAQKIGGNLPDIIALRSASIDAITQAQRSQQRQAMALAAARRHVDDGHLDRGEELLAGVPADMTRVGLLRGDIDRRRASALAAIESAEQAMRRNDLHLAATELARARAADPLDEQIAILSPKLTTTLRGEIQSAINDGELDRATDLLSHLQSLDRGGPETRRMQSVLDHLGDAWHHVRSASYAEANMAIARVTPMLESARWLKQLREQLEQADQATTKLKTGPLAWLGNRPAAAMSPAANPAMPDVRKPRSEFGMPMTDDRVPSKFVMHVDGIGSFLILRQAVVTIGPISSSLVPDIGFVAEPTLVPVTLQRVDDDYFLKFPAAGSAGPSRRLLAAGNRIDLSPRCRLTFQLPSSASTSAALDLTGAKLPRSDIRRVILMDRDVIIGAGPASHVVVPGVDRPIVLHLRDGQLVCQAHEPVMVGGSVAPAKATLPLGESIKIGELSFVLARHDSART